MTGWIDGWMDTSLGMWMTGLIEGWLVFWVHDCLDQWLVGLFFVCEDD